MNSANLQKEITCDLTIVVPCFNEEKYVAQTLKCINEALDQLQIEYEVIVIDDADLDDIEDIEDDEVEEDDDPISDDEDEEDEES